MSHSTKGGNHEPQTLEKGVKGRRCDSSDPQAELERPGTGFGGHTLETLDLNFRPVARVATCPANRDVPWPHPSEQHPYWPAARLPDQIEQRHLHGCDTHPEGARLGSRWTECRD